MSEKYLTDFSSWISQTSQLLREHRWYEIDLPNLIEDSPSLRGYPSDQLEESYNRARRQAAKQTSMKISVFPATCPYSLEH
jgi:hypothetical protein